MAQSDTPSLHKVQFSVGGMTCAACVGAIARATSDLPGVSGVSVDLLGKSASATVDQPSLVDSVVERIEDIGYECTVVSVNPVKSQAGGKLDNHGEGAVRSLVIRVDGMHSSDFPAKVMASLACLSSKLDITKPITSQSDPILHLSYTPSPPELTIRQIFSAISSATTPPLSPSVVHPPSTEELARRLHKREKRALLIRLAVSVVIAIPTFIIGIVYMSLLKSDSPGRQFFEQNIWAGQVTRGEWALLILATPVMFYCAQEFHRRSYKELYALWRPRSPVPIFTRLTRFGSMNLLITMGVSIAYFSSIILLGLAATSNSRNRDSSSTYFDSVVFLTMFLLIGRYIEAFAKGQVTNAVNLLGSLRVSEALLLMPATAVPQGSMNKSKDFSIGSEKGSESSFSIFAPTSASEVQKIPIDLLEVGDIVRIPPGSTPPADGTIVSCEKFILFDESSLTGESREVLKKQGDAVFVGTINKSNAIDIRVDAIGGATMLDQIIAVVRSGQTKHAPIERIADVITSYFVPVITALAIITWVIWLGLGLGGILPKDTIDGSVGGWYIWSLEFAIAVFVIACPCGIGLAAPTALLVGSGLAARLGILAQGGGEAFQESAHLEIVVFDKTGTLTEGGKQQVTDFVLTQTGDGGDDSSLILKSEILGMTRNLASSSSHPLSSALHRFCDTEDTVTTDVHSVSETPGRGLQGMSQLSRLSSNVSMVLGNDEWLEEHHVVIGHDESMTLQGWKFQGKSVVILAVATTPSADASFAETGFHIMAMFAVADRIRKEAHSVVRHLQSQGIETWMISGDNKITANAVAESVGIPRSNVIASVLPHEKAQKVQWLQGVVADDKERNSEGASNLKRRIVAMVGDGINDAPALSAADVAVAVGSGSDVAISSADFILLSSNLHSLLTLVDLSRKVFRRIKFNFFWAIVYNLIAVPIAAGVIYPAGNTRLSPVWSSLAMALSSTSVVCSSLLLRLYKEPRKKLESP